jgi:O-acetyl-ADP-ribose deacetylase (regulator of RNase III)
MLEFTTGNILRAETEAIVCPVNCSGVLGSGLALQFKRVFAKNFFNYKEKCQNGEVKPGKMLVFETMRQSGPKYIINFPIKDHWQDKPSIAIIETGLADLKKTIKDLNIQSIALPALGVGYGAPRWEEVKPIIEKHLGNLDTHVLVFGPKNQ